MDEVKITLNNISEKLENYHYIIMVVVAYMLI